MASPEVVVFKGQLTKFAKKVERSVDEITREAALRILQQLLTETPVDTGRARSNWITSINRPGRRIRTSGITRTGRASMRQALTTLGRYKGGRVIYLSNNLPYIERLNRGWSAQAGPFYVQQIVKRVANQYR